MATNPASRPPWTLDDLLSRSRPAPYIAAAGGDLVTGLDLYNWNAQISAAFHESLHYVEIGLRNTMDNQLTAYAAGSGASTPWYRDPLVRSWTVLPRRGKTVVDAGNGADCSSWGFHIENNPCPPAATG